MLTKFTRDALEPWLTWANQQSKARMSRKMFVKFASLADTLCMKVNSKTGIQCLTFDADGANTTRRPSDDLNDLLVAVHVAGAVGVAKVNQCGINHNVLFALFQKILLNKSFSWNTTLTSLCTSR